MKRIERIKDRIIVTLVVAITIILAVLLLMSCTEEKGYNSGHVDGFDIVIIDSCEYIRTAVGYHGYMAHKGNCRFCAERNRRIIREQVDSILTEIFD